MTLFRYLLFTELTILLFIVGPEKLKRLQTCGDFKILRASNSKAKNGRATTQAVTFFRKCEPSNVIELNGRIHNIQHDGRRNIPRRNKHNCHHKYWKIVWLITHNNKPSTSNDPNLFPMSSKHNLQKLWQIWKESESTAIGVRSTTMKFTFGLYNNETYPWNGSWP